jgi:hypothetical protein
VTARENCLDKFHSIATFATRNNTLGEYLALSKTYTFENSCGNLTVFELSCSFSIYSPPHKNGPTSLFFSATHCETIYYKHHSGFELDPKSMDQGVEMRSPPKAPTQCLFRRGKLVESRGHQVPSNFLQPTICHKCHSISPNLRV